MRCKKHPLDPTGVAGVCASCLRERLLLLISAQVKAQQAHLRSAATFNHVNDCRDSDSHPPPFNFPRSVSPYISRRKYDHTFSDHRFFSTPLVHPTANFDAGVVSCKKKSGKFSKISRFFWPRSEKPELVASRDPVTNSPASSSSAWIPSVLSGNRKTKSRFAHDDRRPSNDRGMPPERTSCDGEDCDRSSGYSSDSLERWKRTPMTAPVTMVRRGKASSHAINVTGFAFCLSPLMRATPNRNRNQKGLPPLENGCPVENKFPVKAHLSTAAFLCANRSRKLADFGRFNNNR